MIIEDQNPNLAAPEKVRKIVLCSGQVYYDLHNRVTKENRNDVAVVRVESICPFPFKEIIEQLSKYKNASVTWSQEEPKNAGGFLYVEPRLRHICDYLGRNDDI